ncbi:BACON domain-containing protein [Labilibaculum euxinus]
MRKLIINYLNIKIEKIVLIFITFGVSLTAMSQEKTTLDKLKTSSESFQSKDFSSLTQNNESKPEAGKLFKEISVDVELNTGDLNAGIPVFTLSKGKIELPIGLNYNSQMHSEEQPAGWLGEDWTTSAEYCISRNVRGYPDEFNGTTIVRTGKDNSNINVKGAFFSAAEVRNLIGLNNKKRMGEENGTRDLLAAIEENDKGDLLYDEFFYSIPGGSGSFLINGKGETFVTIISGVKVDVEVFPKSNLEVLEYFTVTDKKGTKYYFGTNDSAVQYSSTTNTNDEYKQTNKFEGLKAIYGRFEPHDDSDFSKLSFEHVYLRDEFTRTHEYRSTKIPRHKSKWFITKIADLDGEEVVFNYKDSKQNVQYRNNSNVVQKYTDMSDYSFTGYWDEMYDQTAYITSPLGSPYVAFEFCKTDNTEEIPCLESIDASPYVVEFNSTRDRSDLVGADKLNDISIFWRDGVTDKRISKFEMRYEVKVSKEDGAFDYKIFTRDSEYGDSPTEVLMNPFYYLYLKAGQEFNRNFLTHVKEIGENNGELPSFTFLYDNEKIGKKNPYPIVENKGLTTSSSVPAYRAPKIWGKPSKIISVKEHQMLMTTDDRELQTGVGNGLLTKVIFPTGLSKNIEWNGTSVSKIISKDNQKFLGCESYDYDLAKISPYSRGFSYANNKRFKYYGNWDMGVDCWYYPNQTIELNRGGEIYSRSAKPIKKRCGYNIKASRKTTVKLLNEEGIAENGWKEYHFITTENKYHWPTRIDWVLHQSYLDYISSKNPDLYQRFLNFLSAETLVEGQVKTDITTGKNGYEPLRFAVKGIEKIDPLHGKLDWMKIYDKNGGEVLEEMYTYQEIVTSPKMQIYLAECRYFQEAENYVAKRSYRYGLFKEIDHVGTMICKKQVERKEYFYKNNQKSVLTNKIDYVYKSDYRPSIYSPSKVITTLNDGSKSIQEFKYVGNFKSLADYYNQATCNECYQEHINCFRECRSGGGLQPMQVQEVKLEGSSEAIVEPGGESDPYCEQYCDESLKWCLENCALDGLDSYTIAIRELNKKKAYEIPLETLSWKEEDGVKTLLSAQLSIYQKYVGDICRPIRFMAYPNPGNTTSFNSLTLENNNMKYDSRYDVVGYIDRYDAYGNVEEYHSKDGQHSCTIWGYKGQFPVMKVQNASYSYVSAAFGYTNLANLKNSLNASAYLTHYQSMLSHSYMKNSLASFNSYNLKGGLDYQYDMNGNKISYEYDEFGRLTIQKDNAGKILNQNIYHYAVDAVKLYISQSSLQFGAASDTHNVSITSNSPWFVSDNATWITVNPDSGNGNGTLSISCSTNGSTSSRSGTVTVTGGGVTRKLTIYQIGTSTSKILDVSASDLQLFWEAGSLIVSINSNVSWTVSDNAYWINISPVSGTNNGKFTVNFSMNPKLGSRSGTITVSGGGVSKTINVTQEGSVLK